MSKKKSHLYKKYYSKSTPGHLSDNSYAKNLITKSSFSEVIKYLVNQKYIYFTKDGFYHLLPKGVFIQDVITQKAQVILKKEGMLRYRFSTIFSETKEISKGLLLKFKKQLFKVTAEDKKVGYLKYASDPLIFSYLTNRKIDIPYGVYSPDFFFRYFRKGELKPLIQPKEFFMTDFHYFCEPENLETYTRFALLNKKAVELFIEPEDWYLNIDVNVEFFNSNKKSIIYMLDKISINAILNITTKKTHYYSIQNQYIVDYFTGHETQLANLQFDEENGKLFNIKSNESNLPVNIIHGTLFGRFEKILAIIFGKQIEKSKIGLKKPILPLWLSPIVIRIIPIVDNKEVNSYINTIEKKLIQIESRYDIDHRKIPISKKITEAEKDWIPFQVMVGENEFKNTTLSIRDRNLNTIYSLTLDDFVVKLQNLDIGNNLSTQNTPVFFKGNDFY